MFRLVTQLVWVLLMAITMASGSRSTFAIGNYGGLANYMGYSSLRSTIKCPRQINCPYPYNQSPCCMRPPPMPLPPMPLPPMPTYAPLPPPPGPPTLPPAPPTLPPPQPTYQPPPLPPPMPTYLPPPMPPQPPLPGPCPLQPTCGPFSYYNPCCIPPPPITTTTLPTTTGPTLPPVPTVPPTSAPTLPPTTAPTTQPPTQAPTLPPTPMPTYIPVPPPQPQPPCCNYMCPPQPPVCPYAAAAARGKRSLRRVQRSCHVDGQCPSDSSCCLDGCAKNKVCKRTAYPNATMSRYPSKVNISVIFTSGCEDAQAFFKNHLYPLHHYLKDHMNLELIPYGLVKQNGECQHGYGDCLGNWQIACASQHLPSQEAALAFSMCLMSNPWVLLHGNFSSISNLGLQCARNYPRSYHRMHVCGVGREGQGLFFKAGIRQQQLARTLTQVPTIAFDGVVVIQRVSDLAYFPSLLCERLKDNAEASSLCHRAIASKMQS